MERKSASDEIYDFFTDWSLGLFTNDEFLVLMDAAMPRIEGASAKHLDELREIVSEIRRSIESQLTHASDEDRLTKRILEWTSKLPEDVRFVGGFELSFEELERVRSHGV